MSVADELSKLASLKERGVLSASEFEAQKEKLLSTDPGTVAPAGLAKEEQPKRQEAKGGSGVLKVLLWLGGGVVAFLIFGASVGNSPQAQARLASKDAISMCWEEQGRKSLTPGTQRFIAGACEKMEADYRAQYGRNP